MMDQERRGQSRAIDWPGVLIFFLRFVSHPFCVLLLFLIMRIILQIIAFYKIGLVRQQPRRIFGEGQCDGEMPNSKELDRIKSFVVVHNIGTKNMNEALWPF
jgi:hypothetical protein